MANTYTQIYIQVVFTVQGRQNLIKKQYREELHKYITGINVSGYYETVFFKIDSPVPFTAIAQSHNNRQKNVPIAFNLFWAIYGDTHKINIKKFRFAF